MMTKAKKLEGLKLQFDYCRDAESQMKNKELELTKKSNIVKIDLKHQN